jgi:hypothetical protein
MMILLGEFDIANFTAPQFQKWLQQKKKALA